MGTPLNIYLSFTIAAFVTTTCFAETRDPANYVGSKVCGICHKKNEDGNALAKWQAGPHAKASELLGTPEAKAAGAKVGVDNPQASNKCLKCHSTAHNFTESVATEKIKPEEGVSCTHAATRSSSRTWARPERSMIAPLSSRVCHI